MDTPAVTTAVELFPLPQSEREQSILSFVTLAGCVRREAKDSRASTAITASCESRFTPPRCRAGGVSSDHNRW
jgi:hypothetical protein